MSKIIKKLNRNMLLSNAVGHQDFNIHFNGATRYNKSLGDLMSCWFLVKV